MNDESVSTPPAEDNQAQSLEVIQQRLEVSKPGMGGAFSFDIERLFSQAVTANAGVELLERLMVIRREMNSEHAKREYDRALAAFQRDCPIIKKRKAVMQKDVTKGVRYYFAPLDDIIKQVGPYLEKHGFSYTLTADVEASWVRALCRIKHREGHMEESSFKVPIDNEAYMNLPQKYGAAMTFAKRYAFTNGLGIMTADEDNDAQGDKLPAPSAPGDKPKTADEVKLLKQRLTDMTRSVHGLVRGYSMDAHMQQALYQWLIDENILRQDEKMADLTPARLAEVVEKVAKKLMVKS